VESVPDAMVIVNPKGEIILVNAQLERMLGYKREELVGQAVEVLVPEALRGKHKEHRAGYLRKPRARPMGTGMELQARCKDGSMLPVEMRLSPAYTGDGVLTLCSIRDITHHKQLEEQIKTAAIREERTRLARDIHDTLAQSFAGISIQLEGAEQVLPETAGEAQQHIRQAMALARSGLAEARRSIVLLHPRPLGSDLPSAIRAIARDLTAGGQAPIDVSVQGEFRPLSSEKRDNLFRIVQEAVNNALKHAKPTRVAIRLVYGSDRLGLTVEDDGRGFSPQASGKTGLGLHFMKERANDIGAKLAIHSTHGEGTRVEVEVPT
jgi:PAS domain S-box-containing protein